MTGASQHPEGGYEDRIERIDPADSRLRTFVNDAVKAGEFTIPFGKIFNKGLQLGMGQAPVKRYNEYLRNLIIAGKAHPGQIVSHHAPLAAAPDAYKHFDGRGGNWTKVVLKPGADAGMAIETVSR